MSNMTRQTPISRVRSTGVRPSHKAIGVSTTVNALRVLSVRLLILPKYSKECGWPAATARKPRPLPAATIRGSVLGPDSRGAMAPKQVSQIGVTSDSGAPYIGPALAYR